MNGHSDWSQVLSSLGGEVIVKPAHEGSSIGMSVVSDPEALRLAYESASGFRSESDGGAINKKERNIPLLFWMVKH